jgi:divalent metal cation (Fe/Co/Zn/Cd) transporter
MQRGMMMNLEHWGWYSIAVSIVLVLMNWAIAATSGSVAVGAETVHNLVDLLTAVAVLIGLKLSTRKSKSFPYGLYKVENIITVALAVMILVTAYEIAKNAIFTLPHQLTVDPWMIWMLLVATTIPLVFSHFELRACPHRQCKRVPRSPLHVRYSLDGPISAVVRLPPRPNCGVDRRRCYWQDWLGSIVGWNAGPAGCFH